MSSPLTCSQPCACCSSGAPSPSGAAPSPSRLSPPGHSELLAVVPGCWGGCPVAAGTLGWFHQWNATPAHTQPFCYIGPGNVTFSGHTTWKCGTFLVRYSLEHGTFLVRYNLETWDLHGQIQPGNMGPFWSNTTWKHGTILIRYNLKTWDHPG